MARNENPPFERGQTRSGQFASSTANTTDAVNLEGKEWVFEDVNPSNGVQRTNQYVRCRVFRNTAPFALLPKRVGKLALAPNANGHFGGQVDGFQEGLAKRGYVVDEYLPTAGVQPNDLFWGVVSGPTIVLTDLANMSADIAIGDKVVTQTAATSGATTAGRVIPATLTGATSLLADQILNHVGTAMSAATTANTNTGILVDVGKW